MICDDCKLRRPSVTGRAALACGQCFLRSAGREHRLVRPCQDERTEKTPSPTAGNGSAGAECLLSTLWPAGLDPVSTTPLRLIRGAWRLDLPVVKTSARAPARATQSAVSN